MTATFSSLRQVMSAHFFPATGLPPTTRVQLNELSEDGLIEKSIYAELPPRSEYTLTPLGQSLRPIPDAMIMWGETNRAVFERKYGQTDLR